MKPTKSGCFFSTSTKGKTKVGIKKLVGLNELQKEAKYLGNPMFTNKNRCKAYEDLRKRIENKLQAWKSRLLSKTGKIYTLIKSVVSAISLYAMLAFKFPVDWCKDIERMAGKSLWDSKKDGKHYVPIAWSKLCKPKHAGGLGLRGLKEMNMTLLCKLGCLLASKEDKLWVKAVKGKYFVGKSFMKCTRLKNSSWAWRGILDTREILAKGLCFRVGKGDKISIWEDPWVPNNSNFLPKPSSERVNKKLGLVSSLRNPNGSWNTEKIHHLFDSETARNIAKIHISNAAIDDKVVWCESTNGKFTMKSAFILKYWKSVAASDRWKFLWSSKIHERLKFFVWKLANKGLSKAANLLHRNIEVRDDQCIHGCGCVDTDNHLFFHCQVAKALWFAMPWTIRWEAFLDKSLEEKLKLISDPIGVLPVLVTDKEDFFIFATLILDQIWKVRNQAIFENKMFSLEATMSFLTYRFNEAKSTDCKENNSVSISLSKKAFWKKPPAEFIKINTDAAVKQEGSSIGVIARNHLGRVRRIRTVKLQTDIPELAEASAVLQGLRLAEEEGWNRVLCESDARNVIINLNNPLLHSIHWMAEGIVMDILQLRNKFQEVIFSWAPREENFLAHYVSSWSLKSNVFGNLNFSCLPSGFSDFVAQENIVLTNSLL